MINKILAFVQKNLMWLIIVSISSGLMLVYFTGGIAFTPFLCLAAALLMIYPSLVPLDFSKVAEVNKHKRIIIVSLIINFVVSPLLAVLIGWLFLSQSPSLWLGLILLSILPGGGMVTTWAYKSKADMPLTVGIVFANLIAAIVLAPFYLAIAMNKLTMLITQQAGGSCAVSKATGGVLDCLFSSGGSISALMIIVPIFFIIVIPLLLAYFTQYFYLKKVGQEKFNRIKSKFAAFSNLGMLVVLVLLMSIKENKIIFSRPDIIPKAVLVLIIFYVISLGLAWKLGKTVGGEKGRALVWGTYLRYITLALGLAISLVYQDAAYSLVIIIVVLAYLIQIPSSFWLVNKFNK
ncbi:MAG: Sodium/bile acid symporter family protein [Candidatus Falkowbacteria bacterium GW2011_GWF2_39_8]|uniref:Sodium/bile acid symporter family protein n=1 Tax=Candidatus Falkowbacteria bacterium GW2011_GWF2_39_8 TaxID=1618642 RepID=A0A0G0PY99_9BACT|nr:MAG: Sodium/bile acid symporter family protein [Candidatus Falkowbacteria bacterium GW2011_GWF2_39_8]